jgi:3-oxoacyl-[acyl-carrier-protein] synthase III
VDHIAPGTWRDDRALAVIGTGRALPGQPIATRELLDRIAAQFEVNVVRRGLAAARRLNIRQRHLARSFDHRVEGTRRGDGNPDLAARAVYAALAEAGLRPNDLAYLIGHTVTPAEPVPSNISTVARLLRYCGPVAEFRQACTGFINAALFAAGLCAVSDGRPVAVVGSETGSVFFDPVRAAEDDSQLVNFMQMGDGAGAIILGSEQSHTRTARICRLYHGRLETEMSPGLRMSGGGSMRPHRSTTETLEFEHASELVRKHGAPLFHAALAATRAQGVNLTTVRHVLPHQANGRMDSLLAPHLPPGTNVIVHADRVGNTGSAAIWLALDEARRRVFTPGESAIILGAESTNYSFGGFVYEHA